MRDSKEFAFTKLITCGICGSGITADEKYKKLKNGNIASYTYYGCTRSRDLSCKLGYMREEKLIQQITRLIDDIDINEIGLKKQFEEEVVRYNKFQNTVLKMNGGKEKIDKRKEFDIKTYAKYILKEGKINEKRELLASFKSRLILDKNKKLILKKHDVILKN